MSLAEKQHIRISIQTFSSIHFNVIRASKLNQNSFPSLRIPAISLLCLSLCFFNSSETDFGNVSILNPLKRTTPKEDLGMRDTWISLVPTVEQTSAVDISSEGHFSHSICLYLANLPFTNHCVLKQQSSGVIS